MRFFETILSGAALIAAALAVEINDYPTGGVVAGQTYTITYSPKDNTPTTFILRQGESTNLNTIDTITTTATGGSFTWTVPKDLANAPNYALEIRQEGVEPNYSGQFGLTGGSGSLSSLISSLSSAQSSLSSRAASLSSALSSAASASASATITPSASSNSTVSAPTLSRTSGSTSRPTTTSGGPPESTGAASALSSSPLGLVFGAVAAFVYLA